MQKVNRHQGRRRAVFIGGIASLILLADQLSKWWIRANLSLGETLFDAGFFRIVRVHNTGAAFGIFQDHTLILSFVALAGVIVILIFIFLLHSRWAFLDSKLAKTAVALVIGGTFSNNIIDRLFLGYVTDFIDFKVWPAFNIADAAGVVGIIVLAYCIIRLAQFTKQQE